MSYQRSIRLACLCTLWAMTLVSCSTTRPVTFYTLSPLDASSQSSAAFQLDADVAIGVGPVLLPEFLERPHIVLRTTSNRLEIDEFHRWGGSLQEDLSRILAQNLSSLLATNRIHIYPSRAQFDLLYHLALDVQQFDGHLDEGVKLNAVWMLIDETTTEVVLARRFTVLAPATTPDYEALVAAHSAALAALSRDIAAEITRLDSLRQRR